MLNALVVAVSTEEREEGGEGEREGGREKGKERDEKEQEVQKEEKVGFPRFLRVFFAAQKIASFSQPTRRNYRLHRIKSSQQIYFSLIGTSHKHS